IDGDGRLVALGHGGDDVGGAEGRVATEEHLGIGGLEGVLVELGHAPLVEHDADIPLDPGEGVFLADGHQHGVTGVEGEILAGGHQAAAALVVVHGLDLLETHAHQLAVLDDKLLGDVVVDDGDVLVDGVFLLPGGGLHLLEGAAHQHLDFLAAETTGGAATVHGGVAAAEDDDLLADHLGVLEGDAGQPVDADVDLGVRLLAAGQVLQVAAAGGAGADEDRVVVLVEQALEALDVGVVLGDHPHADDVANLLVEHFLGEAERRNLAAHETAAGLLGIEDVQLVAERRQVAGHGEGRGTGAHQGNALAVLLGGLGGDALGDILLDLVVGGDALEAADGDGLFLDPAATAGGLAGAVTGAAEDAGEYVGFPVDHVGVVVTTLGDQTDVFGNRGVRWAGVLAINNFVEIFRILDVRRLQKNSP